MRPKIKETLSNTKEMKTLLKISWRNIWRNRTRTIVISAALVLGLMGGIFSAAIRLAAEEQQFEETVENMISHIQIHHPEFIANPEARYRIPDGETMAEEIAQKSGIKVVASRIVFDGMAASANMNTGVRIKGTDPELEAKTTKLDELLEEGTYFTEDWRLPSVIVGERLAKELNVEPGSRIVLTFQDIHGEMVSASFRIEGLYSVTSSRFEERTVYAKAKEINALIGDPAAITEMALMLEDVDDYRQVARELQEAYPEVEVRHWADLEPSLFYALEVLDQVLIWLVGVIILGVSFGLLNTILMSILERVRELGILLAIGMKRIKVFSMIVLETTMIAVIGGVIGLILSYIMISILSVRGVYIPGGEGMEDFGYASVLYPDIHLGFYFQIGILVIVFAILASIYPAWKAIRLAPAEAVRQE